MPWACGILGSGPGMEPVSIAVEDRFLTTGAPGKSHFSMLYTSLLFLGILLFRLQGVPSTLWILFGPNFPGGSVVRNLPTSAGDSGSVPGLARSLGGGNGNPLQHSCLGNPMERGVWQATVLWTLWTWVHKRVGNSWATKQQQQRLTQ